MKAFQVTSRDHKSISGDDPVSRLIAFYYLMQFSHFIIEFQNEMQLLHFLQLHLYIFNNCIYMLTYVSLTIAFMLSYVVPC